MFYNINFRLFNTKKNIYLCTRYPEDNLFALKTSTY